MYSLFLVLIGASLCNAGNLYEELSIANATMFKKLVDISGLGNMFNGTTEYTVLVPTDAAFAKIPQSDLDAVMNNPTAAMEVVKYHIIAGLNVKNDFHFGVHLYYNSTNGHVIRVYRTASGTHFNQATAVRTNVFASNGVIHLISTVLDVPEGTVMDVLGNPDYHISKFLNLIKEAGLDRNYANPTGINRYTMFAPTDAAIESYSSAALDAVRNDTTNLRILIEYHVHAGTMHASTLRRRHYVSTTLPAHNITVSLYSGGSVVLNDVAHVTLPDIEAENGVVHVIDHVLSPQILQPIIG